MNAHGRDFQHVEQSSLKFIPLLLLRWLPDGRREGREWVSPHPNRKDSQCHSIRIDLQTGHWTDIASGDKGGDVITLAAYLNGLSLSAAASKVAEMLGLSSKSGERTNGSNT